MRFSSYLILKSNKNPITKPSLSHRSKKQRRNSHVSEDVLILIGSEECPFVLWKCEHPT